MRDGDLLVERVSLLARLLLVMAAVSAVLVGKAGWACRMGVCWLVVKLAWDGYVAVRLGLLAARGRRGGR